VAQVFIATIKLMIPIDIQRAPILSAAAFFGLHQYSVLLPLLQ
jgi:hypothetical protein